MGSLPRLLPEILLRAATLRGDHLAVSTKDHRLTYAQLWDAAGRLANVLRSQGVKRGDRVAIYLDNGWHYAVAIFGVLLADGVWVGINPQTRRQKLQYLLQDAGARYLLSAAPQAREFQSVREKLPALQVFCFGQGPLPEGAVSLEEAMAQASTSPLTPTAIDQDLAAIIYTSGTTAAPKGVMHTHRSLLFVIQSIQDYLGITQDDRLMCVLPLTFGYGLCQLFSAVHAGATLLLERSMAYPADVFQRLRAASATMFAGVPTLYAMMLALEAKEALSFPSVRLVTNAAAALPTQHIPGIQRIFPQARLVKMYGQTECIRIAYLDPSLAEKKPASVGRAIPGTELLLLREDGRPAAPGEEGILHVRGSHLMRGYWNQPERTAQALVAGPIPGEVMLRTGDLFRSDEEGDLYFLARSDDVIKSGGEKISPTEVEEAILALAAVKEVVVAGISDPILGQAVAAFISLHDGAACSVPEIKKICHERLEPFMLPKQVIFLPELPRTENGKISRKQVLEAYSSRLAPSDVKGL